MVKIKQIVGLWFEQGEKAKCKILYPDCVGCPFNFVANAEKETACKTIWNLIEEANKRIEA
jgi:hypothetical protein